jgi:hypothetical protein
LYFKLILSLISDKTVFGFTKQGMRESIGLS